MQKQIPIVNTTMLPSLALPSDLAVQFQAGVVEIQDRRNFRTVAHDCATFARAQSGHGMPPFRHVLASIASTREGSSQVQVAQVTASRMQAQATQPDGSHEDWLVDTDPEVSLLRWQRHSAGPATRKCFRLLLPRVSGHLQFWQTGEGRQLMNEAVPGVREDIGTELVAEGEHEALFYSVRGRNALLLTWSGQGRLSIRKIAVDVPPVVGTPGWELIDGKARELAWELIWESDLAGDAELSLHWGVVAAARNFAGRHTLRIPDVWSLLATDDHWSSHRFAPNALQEVDLASDADWTLGCDGGPSRSIKVTAGGWNSDQQSPQIPSAAVKDHVVYERQITIPSEANEKTVKILFGGCNYGTEVWLDEKKITEHVGPMTPFEADLSGIAEPGTTHRLRVKAYTKQHYGTPPAVPAPFDFNKGASTDPKNWNDQTKFAYGLIGYVRLVVLPAVYVSDVFVQPSVAKKQIACDVWISNSSKNARRIELAGAFSAWNGKPWAYPAVPSRETEIPAGQTVKVTLSNIPWTLESDSYWWPNIPFREDYTATLHWLNLSLREGGKTISEKRQRFGFVEHGEGEFYYTVNGVRYTSFSDSNSYGQIGEYDCWTETPCFQLPHGNVKGCPETWKRYQRLGFNSMRLSTSVPTETMLATADEAGYMLIAEGGSWGNTTAKFHRQNFGRQLQDMIRVVRNHPSVARYSICNEPREPRNANWVWRGSIDDAYAADATRPLVMETHNQGTGRVEGLVSGAHAFLTQHYDPIEKVGAGKGIRLMGECDWGTDTLGNFAVSARKYRQNDWAHFAPWSMVNFWPNLLEGMSHARHPWKANNHADRTDGVDGWGSPLIQFLQRSLHPYLVQDLGVLAENPGPPRGHEKGQAGWPYQFPTVLAGQSVERNVDVFNGGLAGNHLMLRWTARWDSPTGPEAVNGGVIPCEVEPGFHEIKTILFTVPNIEQDSRKLYLIFETSLAGKMVFRSEETCLNVVTRRVEAAATFLGDNQTQASSGSDGYELVGHEAKLPAYASLEWLEGAVWIYSKATEDSRALAYFANPPTDKDRIAACRYGNEVMFILDVGLTPRRLTLYFVDYDTKNRKQTVEILDAITGQTLDKRVIETFDRGRYLSWKIQGGLKVMIRKLAGNNAVISGVFLDPEAVLPTACQARVESRTGQP
jgi:hypothetical protein